MEQEVKEKERNDERNQANRLETRTRRTLFYIVKIREIIEKKALNNHIARHKQVQQ